MKKKGLIITLSAVMTVIVAVLVAFAIWGSPKGEDGEKNITVSVAFDNSVKSFKIETDAEFLADALLEEKLIKEDEYKSGFYTYIDGVRADYNLDKCWWAIYKDGEMQNFGMNEITISDGDEFEIKCTPA